MGRYKQLGGSKSPCMKNLPDCSADTLHGKKKNKQTTHRGILKANEPWELSI